jgi:hypothetical protein
MGGAIRTGKIHATVAKSIGLSPSGAAGIRLYPAAGNNKDGE